MIHDIFHGKFSDINTIILERRLVVINIVFEEYITINSANNNSTIFNVIKFINNHKM